MLYVKAQNITQAEYFFDTDPGVGNGVPVTVTTPGSTVDLSFSAPTVALAAGFHLLAFRVKNENAVWSHHTSRNIYITSPTSNVTDIIAAEYFIDVDPGVGLGTAMTIGASGGTVNFLASIPTTSLALGFHNMGIRTKDASGKWGLYENRIFYIKTPTGNMPNITAAEYFLDVDPGTGNASPLAVPTPGTTVTLGFIYDIPLATSTGDHMLFTRVKDAAGNWSHWDSAVIKVDGLQSPSDITNTPTTLSPCKGSSLVVNFTSTGLFGVAVNTFTAQLSDANGSFASPVNIGTVSALPSGTNTAGSVTTTIPLNTPDGTGYRIRIISSAPAFTGAANTGNMTIVKPPTPIITADGPTTFCQGGSVTLTSNVAASYLWSPGGQTTQSITVTASGTFTLTVANANGCFSEPSLPTTVIVNPLPATATISVSGPTTFCAGGSVILMSSAATGNLWSNGATTQSITVTTSGSFTVTTTDVNGCTSLVSLATTVLVNPLPATPTITASGAITFCEGGTVTLTSSAATGNLWSNGATTQSITVIASGSFTVITTDVNGCTSLVSLTTTVLVNPLPATPTISASGPTTFCLGESVTLTSSAASGNLWSNGATTQSITVSTAGSFTVIVTDVNGCSSAVSLTTTVIVHSIPTTPFIQNIGSLTFCEGGVVVLKCGTSSTGVLWSNGETLSVIVVSTAGSYTLTVTSIHGCTSAPSAPVTVTVNPLPTTPTISASATTALCQGGSVVLTSSAATGNLWSNGATTQSITVNAAGSFTVHTINANGCTSLASISTTVTLDAVPATPTITASGPTTFCATYYDVTLTSSAATGYLWSNGATTQSITVNTSGSYTVTTTNVNGCASAVSLATIVTVNPAPPIPTITAGGPTTFCQGGSVIFTSSSATGNTWNGGGNNQTKVITQTGNVIVKVTGANGCFSKSLPTLVTVQQLPVVTLASFGTVCDTVSAFVLTGGLPAGGTYSGTGVSGGQFDPAVAGVGAHNIVYTFTNANGCTKSATKQITVTTGCIQTITVNLKLFLQGYYTGDGTLQPVLNNQAVPLSLATETDTITVELHHPTTFALTDTKKVVLETDGTVSATFTQPVGEYYIAIVHRNTIQTWSASPVACAVATPLYDFSTDANKAFGNNQVEVEPNVWAFFTGDLNQDDFIDGNDFPAFDTDSFNGVNSVYVATDMNGDGFVDGNDFPVFDVNSFNGVSSLHP